MTMDLDLDIGELLCLDEVDTEVYLKLKTLMPSYKIVNTNGILIEGGPPDTVYYCIRDACTEALFVSQRCSTNVDLIITYGRLLRKFIISDLMADTTNHIMV